ncbi:hypothetical protein [Rhizobium leguminosarum]|uniref:hypothetical protein n=1 Tax=Rhizobium leguminosarum TaxID=384 RepID=UPI002E11F656|nr:hypothetical protein U8Q02_40795 [Rhizobium leguminosarum]
MDKIPYLDVNKSFQSLTDDRNGEEFVTTQSLRCGKDPPTIFIWPQGIEIVSAQPSIGSSFDSFLEEEGIKEEVHAVAKARVDAWLAEKASAQQGGEEADGSDD